MNTSIRSAVSSVVPAMVSALSLLASGSMADDGPEYGRLYAEVERLESEGRFREALRALPRVYGSDVPVTAFYATLDAMRERLLEAVLEQDRLDFGGESHTPHDLDTFVGMAAGSPLVYAQLPPAGAPHDARRVLYLLAALGAPNTKKPSNPLLEPMAPEVDLAEAVSSPDPWLVSAGLWLARHLGSDAVDPRAVLRRWQARPDLWDDACTRQALLLLATRPAAEIAEVTIVDDDVREEVGSLQQLPADACIVDVLFTSSGPGVPKPLSAPGRLTLVRLERQPREPGTEVRTRAGAEPIRHELVEAERSEVTLPPDARLRLEPGVYRLEHNSVSGSPPAGYYGKSQPFDAVAGTAVRVTVGLTPAI